MHVSLLIHFSFFWLLVSLFPSLSLLTLHSVCVAFAFLRHLLQNLPSCRIKIGSGVTGPESAVVLLGSGGMWAMASQTSRAQRRTGSGVGACTFPLYNHPSFGMIPPLQARNRGKKTPRLLGLERCVGAAIQRCTASHGSAKTPPMTHCGRMCIAKDGAARHQARRCPQSSTEPSPICLYTVPAPCTLGLRC